MALPGGWELLLILGAIVLLFGATKVPELAKSMGRSVGEFKRGQIEVEKEIKAMKDEPAGTYGATVELTRVQRMAKNLNIDINGKTEEQLLAEIEKKMDEKTVSRK